MLDAVRRGCIYIPRVDICYFRHGQRYVGARRQVLPRHEPCQDMAQEDVCEPGTAAWGKEDYEARGRTGAGRSSRDASARRAEEGEDGDGNASGGGQAQLITKLLPEHLRTA